MNALVGEEHAEIHIYSFASRSLKVDARECQCLSSIGQFCAARTRLKEQKAPATVQRDDTKVYRMRPSSRADRTSPTTGSPAVSAGSPAFMSRRGRVYFPAESCARLER